METVKDNTKKFIIEKSLALFFEKSISEVKMTDIAKSVGIGEATLYRYFKKKQNIVLASAIYLAKLVENEYFKYDDSLLGLEQIEKFYNSYLDIFKIHNEYYKFISEFDAYVIHESIDDLTSYEDEVLAFKNIFDSVYNKGIKDLSIKPLVNSDLFYYTFTNSLLNLCKALSKKGILHQDEIQEKIEEIKYLISILLKEIK